ncbi:Lrp/AsnC family transcriptional regulator [Novosphingobium sp. AAP83]|uniref:Lrp/AsnC family transcriptional regulator n=1 Tax=Novosphingobium sp. AAP83 TaxID=1523425 RepID=UPI000A5253B3|nr:Lrp/AsnC family transcriptional regulator [Novosphingobium sp. AAP83]
MAIVLQCKALVTHSCWQWRDRARLCPCAVLNKLGEFLTVFTKVTLSEYRRGDVSRFESRIVQIDEIVECHLVSGGYGYLLKFVARGVSHYQSIIEGMFESDYGIEKYFSYVVIKSPFIKHHFPIQNLFGQTHT